MKSLLNKIWIIAGLALIMPFFGYADPAPTVTCSPAYSNDLVGKSVSITAHVAHGTGASYDYTWDGDNSIDVGPVSSADSNNITHTYDAEGNMIINVTASSTDSSDYLTGTCSVHIYTPTDLPDFTASCMPSTNRVYVGQTMTWNSNISGPLAPYSVVWTGTDLSSNNTNASISYATSGSKTATMVSFQSRYGAETAVHNAKLSNIACGASVDVLPSGVQHQTPLSVTGTCSASSASQYVNSTTTWNSNLQISGGLAPYVISWTDNDGYVGAGTSVSKVYSTTGTKTAYLTVQDNASNETDIQCGSVSINATPTDNGGGNNGGSNGGGSNGGSHGGSNGGGSNGGSNGGVNGTSTSVVLASSTQNNLNNLLTWLRNNPTSVTPSFPNTPTSGLQNPTSPVNANGVPGLENPSVDANGVEITPSLISNGVTSGSENTSASSSDIANTASSTNPGAGFAATVSGAGANFAGTVAAASGAGIHLVATVAVASGAVIVKYIKYIILLVIIALLSSWLTFFFIKRKNKKDKVS